MVAPAHSTLDWLCAVLVCLGVACGADPGGLGNTARQSWVRQASGLGVTLVAVGQGVGIKSGDLYAEGEGAVPDRPVLKYEGMAWASARPSVPSCLTCKTPRTASVGALTVNAGVSGAVDRWDSGRMLWVTEKTGLAADVLALWASDPMHVFAVGDLGGIALWDGKSWNVMDSTTGRPLRAVFGANNIDVFAVGDGGTVVHFDGSVWKSEESGTSSGLRDVWGSSVLGFFAVGEAGTILHHATF